ncbi:MAG: leucine-rich repeat protein, partial [Clostridia bacterium]|nr:leucine-rich repeat protein [Clostridia bacterium]
MKLTKRALAVVLALVLLCVGVPFAAAEDVTIVDSGTCGSNLTWTLDSEGTLEISGEGEMYSKAFSFRTDVKSVVFGDDVTSIGYDAFAKCTALESVTFGDGLQSIGNGAFS